MATRFGVIRFPGSCDETDAALACERVGEAEILWHGDTDLKGVDAIVVPGGFSYGDYLRVGAIARFAPIMERVAAFAADGGPVLGICNGFQVLCEAGLLPGALLPNEGLRFLCRQVELIVVDNGSAWTGACDVGDGLSIPVKHTTGRYFAPPEMLAELNERGQVALRYARGTQPERIAGGHRRRPQRGRQRARPDAAPRARSRSADRFGRRAAAVRVGDARRDRCLAAKAHYRRRGRSAPRARGGGP